MAADRPWLAGLVRGGHCHIIFAGFLVHLVKMNLGLARRDAPPGRECPWKLGAMLLVAVPVVALGFVLPGPLFQLVGRAAQIIAGTL